MNAPEKIDATDRQKFIGGSDAAGILGISPWRTQLDIYMDKVQPRVEDDNPQRQKVLTRGKRMEPYVIDLLAEETGLQIVRRGERYIDPTVRFLAAEIDAETACGRNVEIKTVSPFKAKEWGEVQTDEIPVHYTAQAMHGLMVTGRDETVFGVLIGGDDFRIYRVLRDDETIAAIRQKEIAFWDRVQRLDPPEPTTVEDIRLLYGFKDSGAAIECNDQMAEDILALQSLTAEAKRIGSYIDERKERLQLAMLNASLLTMNGAVVATWKEQITHRFDQTAFKNGYPDLHAAFTKASQSRVFRLK